MVQVQVAHFQYIAGQQMRRNHEEWWGVETPWNTFGDNNLDIISNDRNVKKAKSSTILGWFIKCVGPPVGPI